MKKILSTFFLVSLCHLSYAASGDSVMIAPTITTAPSMSYKPSVASSGNVYSYTSTTEYQTSVCPSGLTVNGSSIYNSAQRQIIYSYLGSQLVGSQVTAWTDIDTDCSGMQNQVISCPAGYNGNITQQRKVGTASNGDGSSQYNAWNTIASSCSRTDTQTLACPSGYTGSITQQRIITIGIDGSYNTAAWVTTANTCVVEGERRFDLDNYMSILVNNGDRMLQYQNFVWDGIWNENIPGGAYWPGQDLHGRSYDATCGTGAVENYLPEMIYGGYGYQPYGPCYYDTRLGTFWWYKTAVKRRKIN